MAVLALLFARLFRDDAGVIRKSLEAKAQNAAVFVSGISDHRVGVNVQAGSANRPPTYVAALNGDAPQPFENEPTGLTAHGGGTRMHHKFILIDFGTKDARLFTGSYNMSVAADGSNGENPLLIKDRRIAAAYMVEAVIRSQFVYCRTRCSSATSPIS